MCAPADYNLNFSEQFDRLHERAKIRAELDDIGSSDYEQRQRVVLPDQSIQQVSRFCSASW